MDPGRIAKHAAEVHRPLLLSNHGRGVAVAVLQSVSDYEEAEGIPYQTLINSILHKAAKG